MAFNALDGHWYPPSDDEDSSLSEGDTSWLGPQVDPMLASIQLTGNPSTSFMEPPPREPGQVPPIPGLHHAADVQAPVGGGWRGTTPTSHGDYYPHPNYIVYSDGFHSLDEGVSINGGYRHNDLWLPTLPPNDLVHAPDACWGIQADVPQALCTSPTSLQQELPRDDEFPNWIDWDQPEPPTPSSSHALQTSVGGTLGDSNATSQPSQTTVDTDTQVHAGNITVLPQRRYKARQSGEMLEVSDEQPPRPTVDFGPHGYPVSSSLKGKTLADLPNRNRRAFPDVLVGQKLSWRFLFDGCIEFGRQFNVMGTEKTQPTVERIMAETGKALLRFKRDEPRFTDPLDRLVVLEIALVSNASMQAQIGVLQDLGPAYQG